MGLLGREIDRLTRKCGGWLLGRFIDLIIWKMPPMNTRPSIGRRVLRWLRWTVFCLLLLGLLASALLVWDGLHDDVRHADLAVVLGNKVELDGTPSVRLKARLERTAELYKAGWFPVILVSGGVGIEGFDEAAVMKRYLTGCGVPAAAILEDNQGVTTQATAENTARILQEKKWRSVLVVTQYFHISRSVLAMQRCGVEDVASAHAYHFEARDLYSIPREVLGYLKYAVQ